MRIYFIRHGETAWNQLEKIQGKIDNPLNSRGINQAKKAYELFRDIPFSHAYSSTLSRAFETAQIVVGNRDITIVKDNRLIERDFGELEGKPHDAYYSYEKGKMFLDSVETLDEVYERVGLFFQDMVKQHKKGDVILVTAHAHAIRSWAEKMFPENFNFSTRLYNCQGIEMHYTGENFLFYGITDKVETEEQ